MVRASRLSSSAFAACRAPAPVFADLGERVAAQKAKNAKLYAFAYAEAIKRGDSAEHAAVYALRLAPGLRA